MIILIGSISIVASAAGETTVSLGEVTAKRGETVTMDLTLANNPGITGLVVTIGYDKTAMELTNVANGTLFGQFAQGINLVWAAAYNVTDDGVLATLTFKVAEDAAIEDCNVTVTVRECKNEDAQKVTVTGVSGKVTVECAHDDVKWETVKEATCTEAGSEVRKCTICGAELESREITAKGHSYGEWETVKEATCTEAGSEKRVCSVCKDEETREIKASGHNYGEWETVKEATCTEAGSEKRVCSVCKDEETREIKALGHKFGEWTVEKEATAEEDGIESRICSVCQEKETRTIVYTALTEAKETAKEELESYKDAKDYRDEQKKELADAVSAGKEAIDAAKTEDEVAGALAEAKKAIDAIKTDAQLTEEEGKNPEKPDATEKPENPNTPQTGDRITIMIVSVIVLVLAGGAFLIVNRKKGTSNK